MEKIIFATFSIKLTEKKENIKLSHFGEGEEQDLLDYLENFFEEIYTGEIKTEEFRGKKKFHLRMEKTGFRSDPDRCYYGYISSGVSGDTYKIINLETNVKKTDVSIGDGAFKDVFFFFHIPTNRETGYLILQRKGNFGVKVAFEKSFKKYLRVQGLRGYSFNLYNLISGKVYEKMMSEGALKRIELIKSKIPSSLEEFMKNGEEPNTLKGKMKTTISNNEELPPRWKRFLNKIYTKKRSTNSENEFYEVDGIEDIYDEVEFELEFNGKRKTFFVMKQWKTQPDIDVTAEYKEKFGNGISIDNLASLAKSTFTDIFNLEKNIDG